MKKLFHLMLVAVLALTFASCKGSHGSNNKLSALFAFLLGGKQNAVLSGVAATGAPVVGTVYVRDKNNVLASANIASDAKGAFTITIAGGEAPFIVMSEDTETKSFQFSIVNVVGTANVTPATSLIAALALGKDPATVFDPVKMKDSSASLDLSSLAAAVGKLDSSVSKLKQIYLSLIPDDGTCDALRNAVNSGSFNPMTQSFQVGDGLDQILDVVKIDFAFNESGIVCSTVIAGMTISIDANADVPVITPPAGMTLEDVKKAVSAANNDKTPPRITAMKCGDDDSFCGKPKTGVLPNNKVNLELTVEDNASGVATVEYVVQEFAMESTPEGQKSTFVGDPVSDKKSVAPGSKKVLLDKDLSSMVSDQYKECLLKQITITDVKGNSRVYDLHETTGNPGCPYDGYKGNQSGDDNEILSLVITSGSLTYKLPYLVMVIPNGSSSSSSSSSSTSTSSSSSGSSSSSSGGGGELSFTHTGTAVPASFTSQSCEVQVDVPPGGTKTVTLIRCIDEDSSTESRFALSFSGEAPGIYTTVMDPITNYSVWVYGSIGLRQQNTDTIEIEVTEYGPGGIIGSFNGYDSIVSEHFGINGTFSVPLP